MPLLPTLMRWPLFSLAAGLLLIALGVMVAPASAVSETAEVRMENLRFVPGNLEVFTGTTVVWRNITGPSHKVREDSGRFLSPNIPQGSTFSFTFNNSGTYRYHDDTKVCPEQGPCYNPRLFMRGTITVLDAPEPGPMPQVPATAAILSGLGTRLEWTNPLFARQVHLQVIPANDDGPGLDVVLGNVTAFELPPPPAWYGLLPGMTYRWRVRTSEQHLPVPEDHPTWGSWGESTFRTPVADSSTISPVSPSPGAGVGSATPILTWVDSRAGVFYYELQLSKDASFNTNSATAIAAVYGALIHGGVTNPPNSYQVPAGAPLEPSSTYFWRVRPRVQGDGVPVPFTSAFSFQTP